MTDSWTQDPLVRDDPTLRAYLDELASTAQDPVDPAVRSATLQAMLTEAAHHHGASPGPPTWRRRARRVLAVSGVKFVLAGGMAVAATGGGLAATGSLPDPVQQFVHEVGASVGLPIPAPSDHAEGLDSDPRPTDDHAPGQQAPPGTNGHDKAPGQDRDGPERPGDTPAPGQPEKATPQGPADDAPHNEVPDQAPVQPPAQPTEPPGQDQDPPGQDPPDQQPPDPAPTGASDDSPDPADEPGRSGSAPGKPSPAGQPEDTPAEPAPPDQGAGPRDAARG